MIGDVRAVEKRKFVGAVLDPLERVIGIVSVELDLAISPEQRRADRAAQIEIKAGGLPPVRRLADETRTRDAAAVDDAGRFDAIDDLPRVGERASGEREGDTQAPRWSRPSRRPLLGLLRTRDSYAIAHPKPRSEERREASRLEGRFQQAPTQLYAGRVAGSELNPSGITFGIPCRTSSGVTPIAAQPLPP